MTLESRHIVIVGAGKVGTSLSLAFKKTHKHISLVGKNEADQLEAVAVADLILITTQDSEIQNVCQHIAPTIRTGTVVAHCSGSMDSSSLKSAKKRGAYVGSAHPLNTFPNKTAATEILTKESHGTDCFISGSKQATNLLCNVFTKIGFITNVLDDSKKVAYHTACVFLCNYLTSLSEIGLSTAESAGLDRDNFWQATQPLIQSTLRNITSHGTSHSLSGPIARGDYNTVSSHIEVLSSLTDTTQIAYKTLGLEALELAQQRGELSVYQINKLKEILS